MVFNIAVSLHHVFLMKKVKIFLASSIELENEIILFGNEVGKKRDAPGTDFTADRRKCRKSTATEKIRQNLMKER